MTNQTKKKYSDAEIEAVARCVEDRTLSTKDIRNQSADMLRQLLAERNERQPARGVVSDADVVVAVKAHIARHGNTFEDMRAALEALEAHEATKHEVPSASWRPKTTAPCDGSMVRLLVRFSDNATEDSLEPLPTIGSYCEGADAWQFAGWDWQQDCFTDGEGEIVGWLPMVEAHEAGRTAESADGWMPIDTAPKSVADGKHVNGVYLLGFTPDSEEDFDPQALIDVIWWEPLLVNRKGKRGKWVRNACDTAVEINPTYWLPLPQAPKPEVQS